MIITPQLLSDAKECWFPSGVDDAVGSRSPESDVKPASLIGRPQRVGSVHRSGNDMVIFFGGPVMEVIWIVIYPTFYFLLQTILLNHFFGDLYDLWKYEEACSDVPKGSAVSRNSHRELWRGTVSELATATTLGVKRRTAALVPGRLRMMGLSHHFQTNLKLLS